LVDKQDEIIGANNHIKRKNEAIAIIIDQLKEAQQSTSRLSRAHDRLIESTNSI
jgi:hypothetical protein